MSRIVFLLVLVATTAGVAAEQVVVDFESGAMFSANDKANRFPACARAATIKGEGPADVFHSSLNEP